jgi:anaerobic selenocysteine-containing dehydrogenase
MNPEDAQRIGAQNQEKVRVTSKTGTVDAQIEITDEMMPGVVSLPHGWGHNRAGIQLNVAAKHAGASINDLTDDTALDLLCGTAAFNGTAVQIEKL